MDLVTKIKNTFDYDEENGLIKWKYWDRGRRKSLVAGCIRTIHDSNWVAVNMDGQTLSASKIAWAIKEGIYPKFHVIHLDGDGLNLRWDNLAKHTEENIRRNIGIDKRNKLGIPGIRKRGNSYQAYIGADGQVIYLGGSTDFFEACCLRKSAERKYGFHADHGKSRENISPMMRYYQRVSK